MMNSCLPVVASNNKLWKEIIYYNKCGYTVNPNDIDEIKKAISMILDNKENASIMGINGKKAAKKLYNWETQEKLLLDLYEQLLHVEKKK